MFYLRPLRLWEVMGSQAALSLESSTPIHEFVELKKSENCLHLERRLLGDVIRFQVNLPWILPSCLRPCGRERPISRWHAAWVPWCRHRQLLQPATLKGSLTQLALRQQPLESLLNQDLLTAARSPPAGLFILKGTVSRLVLLVRD